MQPIPLSRPMTPELARAIYACKRFKMIDKLSNFPISDGDAAFLDFFQRDRDGRVKGLVVIDLRSLTA